MDDGNRLTVYELVERVIPCIIAKHYSENYIQGFRSTFRNLLAYCNKNEKKYFTAELAQQFMLDCYGVQPGTVERRCSRVHRAMDLLSDYQHFNAVMLRRRLNREFPAGLQEGAVNYLQKLSLHGRRENTLRSHRNVLLRFTDYLFSVGVTDYKLLSADIVNRYVKVVSCNYSNSVVRLHYSILLRFFQYLAHSGYKETDLSLKMMPIVKVSASARIPTTLDLSQIESILASVDRESPQGKRDYAVLMIAVKLGMLWSKNVPLAINTTPVLRHSVHSMTFAMSNNCVYLPFRKNCCKSGRKRDLTKTKPRNVFGFRMCEFFVSICTAMAMMLHVHSTLRLM